MFKFYYSESIIAERNTKEEAKRLLSSAVFVALQVHDIPKMMRCRATHKILMGRPMTIRDLKYFNEFEDLTPLMSEPEPEFDFDQWKNEQDDKYALLNAQLGEHAVELVHNSIHLNMLSELAAVKLEPESEFAPLHAKIILRAYSNLMKHL